MYLPKIHLQKALLPGLAQALDAQLFTKGFGARANLLGIDQLQGGTAAQVLLHFESAKVLGVTATPFRSDRRQLGSFYEKISVEIGLARLIKENWLSRIVIKSVPLPVDLSAVRTTAGDYNEGDLGHAIEPHLRQAAKLIAEHAAGRRTVAFLPLIATSKKFVQACNEEGIRAVHVDGNDREGLRAYERGEFQLVSNASLLSTGWDHPQTDCVFILRPTKSLSLFQQMVGRGTRIADGKDNLLLLDPLFLTDDHSLIKPARLLAHSEDEAEELNEILECGGEIDLLDAEEEAQEVRQSKLEEKLKQAAKRKARTIDAIEFCLSLRAVELADYEPELSWEGADQTHGRQGRLAGCSPEVHLPADQPHALRERRSGRPQTPRAEQSGHGLRVRGTHSQIQ